MDYSNNQEGGYSRRPHYNNNYSASEDGGARPRFSSQEGGERRPRQRFNAQGGNYERAYGQQGQSRSRYNQDNQDGGYQPRPRYNNGVQDGGYQPRPRYNNGVQDGGYQPRPRYNNGVQDGGYQSRPRYNNGGQDGGYQPRPRYNNGGQDGGYQSRPRYNQDVQEGSYQQRPRYNNGGQEGGFQQRAFNKQRQRSANPNAKYSARKRMEYEEKYEDPTKPIRLNKYLANAGICSRREADDFIQAGVITVNGVVVSELGAKILPTDLVKFHEQPVRREKKVYLLLNKPKNTVTTTDDPQERHTVIDIVKSACAERIYPVGRLDRNTTGVLLLTNDGDLAAKLTHPKFGKKKIYAATLDKDLTEEAYNEIMSGITLDDEVIIPDALAFPKEDDRKHVGIQIHSGQNRVVRRIFEKVGYKVMQLDRVSFAGLTKKNLPRGKYRFLTQEEVNILQMGAFE